MPENIEKIYLQPGGICLANEQVHIYSVIGSGIIITIYDKRLAYGGMNYYIRPKRESLARSIPCFACPSIIGILDMFFKDGSRTADLVAHIYGGAENSEVKGYIKGLAERNIKVGLELLAKKKISVIGKDIGGKKGRKIVFNPLTGESIVAKVNRIRATDWYPLIEG